MAGLELKRRWGIPLVHMYHTLGLMKNRVAQSPGEVEGDYRVRGERKILKDADRIIAATPAELAQLQWLYQAGAQRIAVIPPGVDLSHFYPIPVDEAKAFIGIPPEHRMVLFVGRIEPLKGLDVLIEAMGRFCQHSQVEQKQLDLVIIGGEPDVSPQMMTVEMARLQALREKYGIKDMVTFLGKRAQDTLPYYYSAAETVVVPSQYESFGMVALEAMACGKPVVSTKLATGVPFVNQHEKTGLVVAPRDVISLAKAIKRLLDNPELSRNYGSYAKKRVEREFTKELVAARVMNVYEELTRDV